MDNCISSSYQYKKHKCALCPYRSVHRWAVKRHYKSKHLYNKLQNEEIMNKAQIIPSGIEAHIDSSQQSNKYDLRWIENFKIYITGSSRCGKTYLVSKILLHLKELAKKPPSVIVYVYSTWQEKYNEMMNVVNYFLEDDNNIQEKIETVTKNESSLIILDDMLHSKNLPYFKQLFTVQARHDGKSVIFLSQKMFTSDENIRLISQNTDYLIVFKNARNSLQINTLAGQMGSKSTIVDIYRKATKDPFSYLFFDVTQECPAELKFRSHLFDEPHIIRVYVENQP